MNAGRTTCQEVIPERLTLNGHVLDRRSFIGALSLTAAGSLLASHGWTVGSADTRGGVSLSHEPADETGTWHVDDMWGHMPRYAHPIPYSPTHWPTNWDNVDPVDRAFVT